MPDIRINELDPTPGVEETDILPTVKGSSDYKATLGDIQDLILSGIDPQVIFDMVKGLDTDMSGLNANTLQGSNKAFFQNASNLLTGIVPDARLPSGSYTPFASSERLSIPPFLFNGARIMIQYGITGFYSEFVRGSLTFPTPFVSGLTSGLPPLFIMTPECRNNVAGSGPKAELDIRAYEVSNSLVRFETTRTRGEGPDTVRGHWIAIGKY